MGQYYHILTLDEDGEYQAYDRSVDGEYMVAKLTEHSWIGNKCMKGLCYQIHHNPKRIWWVGDYAECYDNSTKAPNGITKKRLSVIYNRSWGRWSEKHLLGFTSDESCDVAGKFIVNHSKSVYIDMDFYIKHNTTQDGWCLHPLSLLTAVGNGFGGGDYRGVNKNLVGSWAGDLISIEDNIGFIKKNCFDEICPIFIDN